MTLSRISALLAVTGCALCGAFVPAAVTTADSTPTPVSSGHSQWAWGAATPQGHDLAAVSFQGATGYAVGGFGTILRSTDSGESWTGLSTATIDNLDSVDAITPTSVVAAGGCALLTSTNSGDSFTTTTLGGAAQIASYGGNGQVRCVDPIAGIAFSSAEDGDVLLRDGTIESTTDGGTTLSALNPVPVGAGHATGLAFSSATTGLAVTSTGLIERTTDGGQSWTQVAAAPQGLAGITVVSPTLAYAVGDDGELVRSVDGGATWTPLPLVLSGVTAAPDLTSITCSGADDCLITTSDPGTVVSTADGGLTGTEVTAADGALAAVGYTSATDVVGVGTGGAIAVSDDAGATFAPTSTGLGEDVEGFNGPIAAGPVAGSAYVPTNDGVLSTTDYGRSWTFHRIDVSAGTSSFSSVAFTSRSTGYALDGDEQLFHTSDGGSHWSPFAEGHSASSTIVAASRHVLLLIGPHGVFRSTDGGVRFYRVAGRLDADGPVLASLRLDGGFATHGAVVAYNSGRPDRIIISTDGGLDWRTMPEPDLPPGGTISVSAISASRMWIYDDHQLWSTSDGGRQWALDPAVGGLGFQSNGDGYTAARVSFSSPQDGVIVLVGPTQLLSDPLLNQVSILQTTDGGRTWAPEVLGGNGMNDYQDVLATPRGDIAAVNTFAGASGDGGIGLFTTAGTKRPAHHLRVRVSLGRVVHGRVSVTGHVTAGSAPDVALSWRINGHHLWNVRQVHVTSDGTFRTSFTLVRTSVAVVAQAVGTGAVGGAGSPVVTLTVRH